MKIIKVSTELEMSVHEFPEGTMREQNKVLYGLIGNGCDLVEHVMPKRLYTELKMPSSPVKEPGKCVSMLIDEEGRLKPNKANLIGSYLYEVDKHGCSLPLSCIGTPFLSYNRPTPTCPLVHKLSLYLCMPKFISGRRRSILPQKPAFSSTFDQSVRW